MRAGLRQAPCILSATFLRLSGKETTLPPALALALDPALTPPPPLLLPGLGGEVSGMVQSEETPSPTAYAAWGPMGLAACGQRPTP